MSGTSSGSQSALSDLHNRRAALDISQSCLVQAPAGSGKTGLLVQRLLACLAAVDRPEQILALTFTRKAAAEMRHRVAMALQLAAQPEPDDAFAAATWALARKAEARDRELGWNLAGNPARLRIQTIDSLNQYLAAQAPLLSGLGAGTTAEDARLLYRRAALRQLAALETDGIPDAPGRALQQVLRHSGNRIDRLLPLLESLLARRDQWLELVVNARQHGEQDWHDIVTDMLVARLCQAEAILPKALADEFVATLGKAADPQVLPWAAGLRKWPAPTAEQVPVWRGLASLLLNSTGEFFLSKLNKGHGVPPGDGQKAVNRLMPGWAEQGEALRRAMAEVRLLPDPQYPESLSGLRDDLTQVLVMLVAELQAVFSSAGEVDFPEVAARAQWALKQGESYTPVMERQDQQIRHLLIDEMQDTSASQVRLLQTLTEGWAEGDGRSLFMVGDPMQSIYAFRQADVRLFLGMMKEKRLGSLPLQVVALESNFRSQGGLIDWFNQSFSAVFPKRNDAGAGLAEYRPCSTVRDALAGDACQWFSAVAVSGRERDQQEARQLAEVVAGIRQDDPEGSIAVLVRARTHLPAILREMQGRGIAYQCQDVDPVQGMPAVADALGLIRAIWHPADIMAWTVMLRAPFVGLKWSDLTTLAISRAGEEYAGMRECLQAGSGDEKISPDGRQRIDRLLTALNAVDNVPEFFSDQSLRARVLWQELGGPACYSAEELADARRLFGCLQAHCINGQLDDPEAFDLAISQLYATPGSGGVQVMTMHKAKGLEYDHVLLPGLGRKPAGDDAGLLAYESLPDDKFILVPKPSPDDEAGKALYDFVGRIGKARRSAEAQRLLYVAATRARRRLYLFGTALWTENKGVYPASGSLLEVLWPVCAGEFEVPGDEVVATPDEPEWVRPRRPALPADWQSVPPLQAWRETRRARQQAQQADSVATMIGEMYHAAMQKMLETGPWDEDGQLHARRRAMSAGFRRRGMPEPRVAPAVDRVITLLQNTFASESGRWLLQPRDWRQAEYPVEGWVDEQFEVGRIDLCFREEADLWIIDYKAAVEAVAEQDVEDYVAMQRERYSPQLRKYARLLAAAEGVQQVRTALFLPELGRLAELC